MWLTIDTAPKGEDVLVFGPNGITIADWGQFCTYNHPKYTHWMALPPPPTAPCVNCGGPEVDHQSNYYCLEYKPA